MWISNPLRYQGLARTGRGKIMSDTERRSSSQSSNGSNALHKGGSSNADLQRGTSKSSELACSLQGILIHNSVQIHQTSASLPSSLQEANAPIECILVPPVERRWEYQVYRSEHEVQDILEEYEDLGELQYLVRCSNGQQLEVSGQRILHIN